jgi:hypothetical protein
VGCSEKFSSTFKWTYESRNKWAGYMSDCQLRKKHSARTLFTSTVISGARGSVVVEALCYKQEGHGFQTRWGWMNFFTLPNPSVDRSGRAV